MNTISQAMEEKLLDYLDGNLSAPEKEKLEQQIQQHPGLKARFDTLRTLHSMLGNNTLEQPAKNFTQQVMARLDHYPRSSSISLRNGIFLLCGVFIVAVVAALLVSAGVFDSATSVIDLKNFNLPQKYIQEYVQVPLPAFKFSGKIMVQIIIVLNLVLGWLVLDRAILKPLFKRRMEMGH